MGIMEWVMVGVGMGISALSVYYVYLLLEFKQELDDAGITFEAPEIAHIPNNDGGD